jgi:hypothetical protein
VPRCADPSQVRSLSVGGLIGRFLLLALVLAQPAPTGANGVFGASDGACGQPRNFQDRFEVAVDAGTLTIAQPGTGSVVSGPVGADGTFADVGNASEHYRDGLVDATTITARYEYTKAGCTQTWSATFTLDAAVALPTTTAPPTTVAPAPTAPVASPTSPTAATTTTAAARGPDAPTAPDRLRRGWLAAGGALEVVAGLVGGWGLVRRARLRRRGGLVHRPARPATR